MYQAPLGADPGCVGFAFNKASVRAFFMLWSPSFHHSCESNGKWSKGSWKGRWSTNEKHVLSAQKHAWLINPKLAE